MKRLFLVLILAATIPLLAFRSRKSAAATRVVRVRPVPGRYYSPAFLRLCERSRFRSAQEAIKRVKDRSVEYRLVCEAS